MNFYDMKRGLDSLKNMISTPEPLIKMWKRHPSPIIDVPVLEKTKENWRKGIEKYLDK